MNIKNLIMWVIIVLLSVGLFNMFQDPSKVNSERNTLPFSKFLNEQEYELFTSISSVLNLWFLNIFWIKFKLKK